MYVLYMSSGHSVHYPHAMVEWNLMHGLLVQARSTCAPGIIIANFNAAEYNCIAS